MVGPRFPSFLPGHRPGSFQPPPIEPFPLSPPSRAAPACHDGAGASSFGYGETGNCAIFKRFLTHLFISAPFINLSACPPRRPLRPVRSGDARDVYFIARCNRTGPTGVHVPGISARTPPSFCPGFEFRTFRPRTPLYSPGLPPSADRHGEQSLAAARLRATRASTRRAMLASGRTTPGTRCWPRWYLNIARCPAIAAQVLVALG